MVSGMVGGRQASPMIVFKNHSSLQQVLVDGKHWHGGLLILSFVEERLGVDFARMRLRALLNIWVSLTMVINMAKLASRWLQSILANRC